MNADQAAFLRKIREQPDCDVVRLVYADWLEENGQAERAELIRLSIENFRFYEFGTRSDENCWCELISPLMTCCDVCQRHEDRFKELENRLIELANKNKEWFTPVQNIVSCGFVYSVTCTLDWWLSHGPELVRWHPVQRVEVTDRQPWQQSDCLYAWWQVTLFVPHGATIHQPVFRHIRGPVSRPGENNAAVWFDTIEAAESALSRALIAWALERIESDQPNFLATSAAVSASSGA